MKRNEIEVGTEYAVSERVDYGSNATRATITGPAQVVRVHTRGTYRGTHEETRFPATVHYPGGDREEMLPGRKIKEPWGPYAARQAASRALKVERELARAQARDERAARLLHLIPALRHAGVPDTKARLHRKAAIRSMLEHIPDCLEQSPALNTVLTAPLAASIEKYVEEGAPLQIDAETLLRIL